MTDGSILKRIQGTISEREYSSNLDLAIPDEEDPQFKSRPRTPTGP
jgi:hypothetical protein